MANSTRLLSHVEKGKEMLQLKAVIWQLLLLFFTPHQLLQATNVCKFKGILLGNMLTCWQESNINFTCVFRRDVWESRGLLRHVSEKTENWTPDSGFEIPPVGISGHVLCCRAMGSVGQIGLLCSTTRRATGSDLNGEISQHTRNATAIHDWCPAYPCGLSD